MALNFYIIYEIEKIFIHLQTTERHIVDDLKCYLKFSINKE